MTHPTYEQWMEYLYGELDSKKQSELKAHLQECSECQADVDSWRNVMTELDKWKLPKKRYVSKGIRWAGRWAVAAVLLIAVGYAVGQLAAGPSVDVEQLRSSLETSLKSSLQPAIRRDVLEQVSGDWQLAFANGYVQLKDELIEQFRDDLDAYAIQILAASNTVTNQLLTELIRSINAAQTQDRRWVAAALEQMERNDIQLKDGLVTLAGYTTDELHRTKQDLAQWITYSQPDNFESETAIPSKERSEK